MTAYVVLVREKTINRDELSTYSGMARATLPDYNITPVVSYGDLEVLEGAPPESVAIVSFPNMAEAKAWYESPAYQKAAVHRWAGAKDRMFIVEGL